MVPRRGRGGGAESVYRGTSLIRKRPPPSDPLGPFAQGYCRVLGGGCFLEARYPCMQVVVPGGPEIAVHTYDTPLSGEPPPLTTHLPPWRQPKGKWMVSVVNSHTNTTSKRWHLWEIDLRFALNPTPGWLKARLSPEFSGHTHSSHPAPHILIVSHANTRS